MSENEILARGIVAGMAIVLPFLGITIARWHSWKVWSKFWQMMHKDLQKQNERLLGEMDMSELNVYHHELRHNEYDEFYLKYKADKVIAELKADYKEACDRLQTANLIKDEQLAATRHSKHKRCLNKAEWCEERSARYDLLQERTGFDWSREIGFYFKWQQRWLELAEKFKEAK